MGLAIAKLPSRLLGGLDLYGFVYALLLASVVLVNLLVLFAAMAQNHQEVVSEQRTVETVLTARLGTLIAETRDNGIWSEGYENLVTHFDADWMRRNYDDTFYRNFGADVLLLLDTHKGVLHGLYHGQPFETGLALPYIEDPDIAALFRAALEATGTEPNPLHGYAMYDGTLYLATAVRVSTERPPYPDRTDKDVVFMLLSAVDDQLLARISADYGIHALHRAAPGEITLLAPATVTGANAAGFAWRPRRPGDDFLRLVLPPVLLMALLVAICGFFAIRRLRGNMRQLETALAASASASQAKSEFLAAMSHELRTPLNAVIGFSDIMAEEMFGPLGAETYREFVVTIRDSARHLLTLIDDVLDASKLESRSVGLREEIVALPELLDRAVNTMKAEAGQAEVALTLDLPPGLPAIRADGRRMQQIVLNILSNAIKFNHKGGHVEVIARRRDGAVEISIADSGIGIAPQDVRRALERFGQVDSRLNRSYEGSGLGLSLAKELIELHGGTLQLDSEPDVGTRVTLIIPAERVLKTEQPATAF